MFTAFSTILINWYLSIQALKQTLAENHLENNYQYALKVSSSTNDLLFNMKLNLGTLAEVIGEETFTQSDLDYWKEGNTGYYNSLFTTDTDGIVQLMSPQVVSNQNNVVKPGTKITTELMKQALQNKTPFISDPYLAQSGNLVVLISYPIFDTKGEFKGVVDGTLYLEEDNSLSRVLHHHEFLDESSVFVVDRNGRIIFHPDKSRINESIADHPLVQDVIKGKNGTAQIINNRGVEYFSGYAYVKETGWGIITQTPSSVINEPLQTLTKKMILQSLPWILLIFVLAWILTNNLTKPINKLASYSEKAILQNKMDHGFQHIEFKSNIYEVRKLFQHLQKHFQILNNQIQTDGLTGLRNRRAFDFVIEKWVEEQIPFSLIMLDIDKFKKVNDDYGHLVGDDVLRFLAMIILDVTRTEDLCFRYGGEEFSILLKDKDTDDAYILAERLREKIEETPSPTGKPITISLGITSYQKGEHSPAMIIKRSDIALYQSKNKGRNQTSICM